MRRGAARRGAAWRGVARALCRPRPGRRSKALRAANRARILNRAQRALGWLEYAHKTRKHGGCNATLHDPLAVHRHLGQGAGRQAARSHRRGEGPRRGLRRQAAQLLHRFGEYDGIAICEFPDNTSVAACSMSAASTGAFTRFETTTLLTAKEAEAAMKQAHETKTGVQAAARLTWLSLRACRRRGLELAAQRQVVGGRPSPAMTQDVATP